MKAHACRIGVLPLDEDSLDEEPVRSICNTTVDGSNYRAVQDVGVPSGAALRSSNTFDATINVVDDGQSNCSLTVGSVSVGRVTCDVL